MESKGSSQSGVDCGYQEEEKNVKYQINIRVVTFPFRAPLNWKIHIIVITFIKMSFFLMCLGVSPTCLPVYCMYGTCEGQKKASGPPELEL